MTLCGQEDGEDKDHGLAIRKGQVDMWSGEKYINCSPFSMYWINRKTVNVNKTLRKTKYLFNRKTLS